MTETKQKKTTITLTSTNGNNSCSLRVIPMKLNNKYEKITYQTTHFATVTKSQIAKLRRELPYSSLVEPAVMDQRTGKIIEGLIHFNL